MDNSKMQPRVLKTYCKSCEEYYVVTDSKKIFSGGEFSKYATRCPICGFGRGLPFKQVETIFGKLEV